MTQFEFYKSFQFVFELLNLHCDSGLGVTKLIGSLCEIFKFGDLDKGVDIFQFHEQLLSFLFSE